MTKRKRRRFTPDQRVVIFKKHLVDREPVSDICDEFKRHPVQFYKWQKTFFESGFRVFERAEQPSAASKEAQKMAKLKQQVKQKDEVIAELLFEHFQLKKRLAKTNRGLDRYEPKKGNPRFCGILAQLIRIFKKPVAKVAMDRSEHLPRLV